MTLIYRYIFISNIIVLIFLGSAHCQSYEPHTVTPPAPDAAAITKYGMYPVSMFTGIPKISLPIYTIKSGNMILPISLDYHASGIKVDDYAGNVGLGWILNAGGAITRQVIGVPDDYAYTGIFYNPVSREGSIKGTDSDYYYLKQVAQLKLDSDPDLFSFNFCGKSGKFVFKPNSNRKALMVEYDNLQITLQQDGNFKVLDAEGNTYLFEQKVISSFSTDVSSAMFWPVTSWYLTKAIPTNSTDTISLSYDGSGAGFLRSYSQTNLLGWEPIFTLYDDTDPNLPVWSVDYRPLNDIETTINYNNTSFLNVTQICFPNGQVNFKYSITSIDYGGRVLDSILVQNASQPVKKFGLSHSYFYSTAGYNPYAYVNDQYRLKLIELKEYGTETETGDTLKHKFEYEEQTQLPPRKNFGVDLWGYYNGHSENNTLLTLDPSGNQYKSSVGPGGNVFYSSIRPGIRTYDATAMQAGILKKIVYPTGGYTAFEFEPNVYLKATGLPESGGGLRIKSISSYTADGLAAKIENYKYGDNENGYGRLSFIPSLFDQNTYSQHYSYYFITPDIEVDGVTPRYATTYLHILDYPLYHASDFGGSKVAYTTVTKYENGNAGSNGKTIYTYDFELDDKIDTHAPTSQSLIDLSWKSGHLISEKSYRSTQQGNYQLIKEDSSVYNTFMVDTAYGLGVAVENIYTGNARPRSSGPFSLPSDRDINEDFYYFEYPIYSASKKRVQNIQKIYSDDPDAQPIVTQTNYFYENPQTLLPTKMELINSKGDTRTTTYKYPHDFVAQSPYHEMVNTRHIWSPIIEQAAYNKNGTNFLQSSKTNYNFWNNGWGINSGTSIIVPQSIESKTLNLPLEIRLQFNNYDVKGNLLEQQKANDVKEVYLWGYNSEYPVAKVVGSDYATVRGFINQSILDNPSNDQVLKTELNKVRTGLSGTKALVTTYTYAPLIGMTSQTDPNNRASFYEYDSYNRLKLIRDQNGYIVKKFCYNYAGQPVNCDGYFTNSVESGSFQKNNCATGYTGSVVTYTVPAGAYNSTTSQSAADQLAINDVNANGQAYANLHGSCSVSTIYARLTYENVFYGTDYGYGDIVVRFYSDAAGTQPVSVNNLALNFEQTDSRDYNNPSHQSMTVSGSSAVIQPSVTLYDTYTECDYGYWPCYTYNYNIDYYLDSGSGYTIIN